MKWRSWLNVAGNSEEQLGQAIGTGADVVVVDLEDAVPLAEKPRARELAAQWLTAHRRNLLEQRRMGRWVRINALDSGLARDDLVAIMPSAPDGIVLPKSAGPETVRQLASELYELEQVSGVAAHATLIVPVAGETPRGALGIAAYCESTHQRLHGLAWGKPAFGTLLGGSGTHREAQGPSDVASFVRAQAVLAAHAAEVMAVDAAFNDIENTRGLRKAARRARSDGFVGMFANHPGQIEAINAAFTPSAEELARARDIVAAFETNPNHGSLPLHGHLVTRSDLVQARRTIAMFEAVSPSGEDGRRPPMLLPA